MTERAVRNVLVGGGGAGGDGRGAWGRWLRVAVKMFGKIRRTWAGRRENLNFSEKVSRVEPIDVPVVHTGVMAENKMKIIKFVPGFFDFFPLFFCFSNSARSPWSLPHPPHLIAPFFNFKTSLF